MEKSLDEHILIRIISLTSSCSVMEQQIISSKDTKVTTFLPNVDRKN